MTLEEVKAHFKDAKIVESMMGSGMFDITTGVENIGIHSYEENYYIELNCNVHNMPNIKLWDKYKGFAKIIEYKDTTQINIDIPQGYEVDKVVFKKIEKQLPNSWDEYRVQTLGVDVYFNFNKYDSLPEAYKDLRKLELLRDCYNDGWVADTDNNDWGYSYVNSQPKCLPFLNFKTAELRDKFLENFKDIIEIAKPLL